MNDNSRTFPPSGLRPIGPITESLLAQVRYRQQQQEQRLWACVGRWRAVAVALVQCTDSTPEQRAVAWRFLKRWGVHSGPDHTTPPEAA